MGQRSKTDRVAAFAVLLPIALAIAACGTAAAEVEAVGPVPRTAVVDDAQIISAENERALNQRLTDYWNESGTAIVIHTTASLNGATIEEYSFERFNAWGIGDRETHRGILIVIAPTEKETRLEVGCGLETVLTNQAAATIVEGSLIPFYRAGQWAEGSNEGIDAIQHLLANSAVEPGPVSPICVDIMKEAA